ncbi:hypothetical protein [Streptomyces sp. NPDC005322]
MQQGLSNREACRIVGIDRRTGQKWRNGRHAYGNRKALPPINAVAAPSGPSRYLREARDVHDRERLARPVAARLERGPGAGGADRPPIGPGGGRSRRPWPGRRGSMPSTGGGPPAGSSRCRR